MGDLEELIKIRNKVLNKFAEKLPEMVKVCTDNNYLCYFIQSGEEYQSVVDFTQKMPNNIEEYQNLINKSAINYYQNMFYSPKHFNNQNKLYKNNDSETY
jgi:hypothetical protein